MSIKMGELKSEEGAFENRLKQSLRPATTWSAVVLIDEANVFLEHRKSSGGDQSDANALLAVFLRHLEYFQGIIFLASNRVEVFDAAVKSRMT
jgi:AAA+ superfamily predicted ATPase